MTLPIEATASAQYSDLALANAPRALEKPNSYPAVDPPEGIAEVPGSFSNIQTNRPRDFPVQSRSIRHCEDFIVEYHLGPFS